MEEKRNINVTVCGTDYFLVTDERSEYMESLAAQIEREMNALMFSTQTLSITTAAIFAAMEFCDKYVKADESADNLRGQIKAYVEEAGTARMEAEEAKREVSRLNQQLQLLKMRLARHGETAE